MTEHTPITVTTSRLDPETYYALWNEAYSLVPARARFLHANDIADLMVSFAMDKALALAAEMQARTAAAALLASLLNANEVTLPAPTTRPRRCRKCGHEVIDAAGLPQCKDCGEFWYPRQRRKEQP